MYTLNDFFCGCGGMGLGFKQAGFDFSGSWDFDKYAVQSYRANVDPNVIQADITEMTIDDVPYADVWAFGFPCQDLSVAGEQKGIVLECLECGESWEVTYDTYTSENPCPRCGCTKHKAASRSGLFFEIMRLLDEATERERERESQKLPLILLAENVKALRPYLPILEAEYNKRGYKMYNTIYNSKYFDVPQNRERYFVVGVRNDLPGDFVFPTEQHDYIPKLSSVLETDVDEKFFISDDKAAIIIEQALKKLESLGDCHATITPDNVKKNQNGPRAKENEKEMFTLTTQYLHGVIVKDNRTPSQLPKITQIAHKGSGGQKGFIHHIEGIVGAVTATDYKDPKYVMVTDVNGDRHRVRRCTPTEYGRLQAFPMDNWQQVVSNTQAYKQFGNAVTVTVARTIAIAIKEFLDKARG